MRPQVNGIVAKRLFTEGGMVKAGEPLYQIEDASYRAQANSARAQLARAEATANAARLSAKRITELAKVDAVSQQDLENAVAAQKQAEADVGAARASLDAATLGYARITAPISGASASPALPRVRWSAPARPMHWRPCSSWIRSMST